MCTAGELAARALLVSAVATGVLAGCNGGSSAPIDQFGCPTDSALEQLIYPAPGSTAIPDAVSPLVLAGPIATVTLQPPSPGNPIVTSTATAVPNPIPSPNAAPRTSPISAYVVPALAAATTYTVIAQAPPPGGPLSGCPPQPAQTLGSFTTQ